MVGLREMEINNRPSTLYSLKPEAGFLVPQFPRWGMKPPHQYKLLSEAVAFVLFSLFVSGVTT